MNDPKWRVQYTSPYGDVTWTLPPDAIKALSEAPADVRNAALEAFGSNITILCGAMLKSFGNPAIVETLNIIMREVYEIVERPLG